MGEGLVRDQGDSGIYPDVSQRQIYGEGGRAPSCVVSLHGLRPVICLSTCNMYCQNLPRCTSVSTKAKLAGGDLYYN